MQREKQLKMYLEIYSVFQGTVPTVSQVLLRQHKQEWCPWRGNVAFLIWHMA